MGKKGGFEVVERHTTWSPSKLGCYEECPAKAKYKYISKLPDPGGPALVFGSFVHEALEMYVTGRAKDLPLTYTYVEKGESKSEPLTWNSATMELANDLRAKYKKGKVRVELEIAFNSKWEAVDWMARDCWCRFKLDLAVFGANKKAEVIDWKTGKFKPDGEYDDQLKMYCMALLTAMPELKEVSSSLWFTEAGAPVRRKAGVLTRLNLRKEQERWEAKAATMFGDTVHAPSPGIPCRWCPFSMNKRGPCKF